MMVPTYEIRTVADFLEVPTDRRAACLEDFTTWLEVVGLLLKAPLTNSEVVAGTFLWIDDGRRGVDLRVMTPEPSGESGGEPVR